MEFDKNSPIYEALAYVSALEQKAAQLQPVLARIDSLETETLLQSDLIRQKSADLRSAQESLASRTTENGQLRAKIDNLEATRQAATDRAQRIGQVIGVGLMMLQHSPKLPYKYGGNYPAGLDCSALTQTVYKIGAGVALPRVSRDQAKAYPAVEEADLQPGDLLAFDTNNDGVINHIGIYLGGGQMLHTAGNPEGINSCDWKKRYKVLAGACRPIT